MRKRLWRAAVIPRFKTYDYDQHVLVAINYLEQLQPGTFENAVHYLIELKPDLSVFHSRYCNDATGRYAPEALIELADTVTEMKVVKHAFKDQGVRAQKGVEL